MITMQDVAERAGVNKGTVSYVLNGKHKKARIGPETCTRIKSIAKKLGYRHNELARSVATGKSNVIAFVSCNVASREYIGKIMSGIMKEITKQNFSLKVYHLSGNSPLDIAGQIIRQRVDGVIFYSPENTDFQIIHKEMKRHHIPCAATNLTNKNACIGVTTDDFYGIKEAVKYLAGLGHHRILYLSRQCLEEKIEYITQRNEGYIAGMKEYVGKSVTPQIQFLTWNSSENRTLFERILKEPATQRPTAILCISDMSAMEILQVAYKTGIKVPKELSVIGFADLEMAKYATVPLTTIAQPFEEMGKETANMLLGVIKTRLAGLTKNEKNRKLKVKLVIRESTAPPKKELS